MGADYSRGLSYYEQYKNKNRQSDSPCQRFNQAVGLITLDEGNKRRPEADYYG
jgi:hypothetical protein